MAINKNARTKAEHQLAAVRAHPAAPTTSMSKQADVMREHRSKSEKLRQLRLARDAAIEQTVDPKK